MATTKIVFGGSTIRWAVPWQPTEVPSPSLRRVRLAWWEPDDMPITNPLHSLPYKGAPKVHFLFVDKCCWTNLSDNMPITDPLLFQYRLPAIQHFAQYASAHSNSVLTFRNNVYRHTCYCLSSVKQFEQYKQYKQCYLKFTRPTKVCITTTTKTSFPPHCFASWSDQAEESMHSRLANQRIAIVQSIFFSLHCSPDIKSGQISYTYIRYLCHLECQIWNENKIFLVKNDWELEILLWRKRRFPFSLCVSKESFQPTLLHKTKLKSASRAPVNSSQENPFLKCFCLILVFRLLLIQRFLDQWATEGMSLAFFLRLSCLFPSIVLKPN